MSQNNHTMTSDKQERIVELMADASRRKEAFEGIVALYAERLYWKIRHFVTAHEDADDVLQNTFLKIWRSLGGFKGESQLSTWLFRIAINESLEWLRSNKRRLEAERGGVSDLAERLMADRYFDGDEAQAALMREIDRLPEVQRTVFTLRYFDEMKYGEMSEILHTSEGSLKASYHHAVQKIRAALKDHPLNLGE